VDGADPGTSTPGVHKSPPQRGVARRGAIDPNYQCLLTHLSLLNAETLLIP
jgi:hypothetical protein